ncbi:DNA repair protein RecO [Alkalibacter mobilis]|uniref:DNA repair protein RecO n=1 Tax=Alkalibacter mobilis TaxID=2787712 RepID=UPI00189E95C9|nr:DNA repair protein RecO [Alkalibacter mobilis]MBF7096852.1 DNA repair protein RecO [Alkalibacter mobilis]
MAMDKAAGLVIKSMNYGENDKIITLFTKEHGKITAMVKGARNPKSAFMGATQLFCYSNFVYYTGRSFAYLNQAEIVESFHKLRNDLGKLSKAAYFVEAIDLSFENYESDYQVLRMALNLLYFLNSNSLKDDNIVLLAFQLKFLSALGFGLNFSECGICGKPSDLSGLMPSEGVFLCKDCLKTNGASYILNREEISYLENIHRSSLKALICMDKIPQRWLYISDILNKILESHVGRRIKSFEFIANNI